MPYLYLFLGTICMSSSSLFGSFYNEKSKDKKDAAPLYAFLQLATVFFCWMATLVFDCSFSLSVLPYAIGFGVCYAVASVATILALRTGPITLTSLFLKFSLLAVSVWGLFFWETQATMTAATGIVLVILSIALILFKGNRKEKEFSWKWLLFALLAFAGNAGCSILQRGQQKAYGGEYGAMLMSAATGIAFAVCLVLYLKSDKRDTKSILKNGWYFPVCAGAGNVLLNVCVMKLAISPLSPSLIYPFLAVGGLGITTLFSLLVFKEKLRPLQWLGFAAGALAVALLSL